jgi:hypothetical protein
MQMLNRVEGLEAGNPMPPTRALPAELIAIYQVWINAGMPNTAADAAALSAPASTVVTPAPAETGTPPPGTTEVTPTP